MISKFNYSMALFLFLFVSGCASPIPTQTLFPLKPASVKGTDPTGSTEGATETDPNKWIKITPLSVINNSNKEDSLNHNYSSMYTRLRITSHNCSDGHNHEDLCKKSMHEISSGNEDRYKDGVYTYVKTPALLRFFFGAHNSATLTSKIKIGAFEASVPLVTIDRDSKDWAGESFTRTVYHTAQDFPLFLIKKDSSNAIVSTKFLIKASSEPKSNVGAAIIQTAQAVAKVTSPQGAVFTKLTEQSTKDLAMAIDNTISKILATKVDEEQWIDNDIRSWGQSKDKGIQVTFRIPEENFLSWDYQNPLTVGVWTVQFEDPRPSIFSDVRICASSSSKLCKDTPEEAIKEAQGRVKERAEEILSYKLVNNAQGIGTIENYLKQQDWWTQHRDAFIKKQDGKPEDDDIRSFCRSIKSTIVGLDLNHIDAGIVTEAIKYSRLVSIKVKEGMQKQSDDCSFAY